MNEKSLLICETSIVQDFLKCEVNFMAQELSLLDIDEVSLVDAPANSSVDPATGRKVPRARVALTPCSLYMVCSKC